MKQTAVEWLYDRFLYAGYAVNSEWKKQAKKMEKEQIEDAWIEGGGYSHLSQQSDKMLAGEYYKETFNKEQQRELLKEMIQADEKDGLYDELDATLNDGIED